jgi:hypothetical protein
MKARPWSRWGHEVHGRGHGRADHDPDHGSAASWRQAVASGARCPDRRPLCDHVPPGHRARTPMRRGKPAGPRQTPAQCVRRTCARGDQEPAGGLRSLPSTTRLRRILSRLRSPIAQRRSGAAQSAAQSLSAWAEGAVVGPTMSPTMAARRLRCRIVTDGRGSWPSAWSGSAGELTRWNTRTPPRPGPPAAPPRRARCAAVGTARGMRRGHGGEPLRGGDPPGRHGGRSVHPDRQRAVP